MKILHLSFTYPDSLTPKTTWAVKRLIESIDGFSENHCVSLHNGFPQRGAWSQRFPDHTIVSAFGLPLHLGLRAFLQRCRVEIERSGIRATQFDLLHAHCLTREGVIAEALSRRSGVPYYLSIRATDLILLRLKPYLRGRYENILRGARRIAVVAPWLETRLKATFAQRWDDQLEAKLYLLGNVVDAEPRSNDRHNDRYVMPIAINQSQLKRKNVARTLRALSHLKQQGKPLRLDIVGQGSGVKQVEQMVKNLGLQAQVSLPGPVDHAGIIDFLAKYKGLVLCSHPETFGLVYLEALNAGIPVLHAQHTGMDGLFPEFDCATSADPGSHLAIASAWERLDTNHRTHKSEVVRLQASSALHAFNSGPYAQRLRDEFYV